MRRSERRRIAAGLALAAIAVLFLGTIAAAALAVLEAVNVR